MALVCGVNLMLIPEHDGVLCARGISGGRWALQDV